MKILKNDQTEVNILELEKALQGIGKEAKCKRNYASKVNADSLNMLRTTKKLHRNWV
ncbi:MAG: hypothetical protein PSN36_01330 [Gammaproteobacteria bacterium]|nr:hypothetical protein [Gammaproteobacteria bacterium]